MSALASSPDLTEASDLLKNLSLGSQPQPVEIPEAAKKLSSVKSSASEAGNGPSSVVDRSTMPVLQELMDPNMCYFPNGYASPTYYFGGYGGHMNEWEGYGRYDGNEGIYGENATMMYHPGYGYPPYGAYPPGGSSVSAMGPDGQIYGPQHYQYTTPYYPQQCNSQYQTSVSNEEVSTSVTPDQGTVPVETPNGSSNGVANGNAKTNTAPLVKPSNQASLFNSNGSHGCDIFPSYQDSRFTFDGTRASGWLDGPVFDGQHKTATSGPLSSSSPHPFPGSRNQNTQALTHVMGLHPSRPNSGVSTHPAFVNRIYSNSRVYNHSAGASRAPQAYGSNGYDSRITGRGWLPFDSKYKPRGCGNGYLYFNENTDALNEQNKGPRASRFKNQRSFPMGVTLAVKGRDITLNATEDSSNTPDKDQYNRTEFVINYSEAKFFVIKSYSEDDVHKSIKYNVWASTPNGNKKLDVAYQDATGKNNGCPVFLLFSVNTSGQFCGLAEMVGPVDFNKTLDYWQQDKWTGCFPVKWHIIKDIPNSLLKHIILENNDSKPVTNSRDTQEVKFEQGLEILQIFKGYVSKTCIVDDFGFYESRQKQMQESRSKLRQLKQIQKPMWDGKKSDTSTKDTEGANLKPTAQPVRILQKDSTQCLFDREPLEENAFAVEAYLVADGVKAGHREEGA